MIQAGRDCPQSSRAYNLSVTIPAQFLDKARPLEIIQVYESGQGL